LVARTQGAAAARVTKSINTWHMHTVQSVFTIAGRARFEQRQRQQYHNSNSNNNNIDTNNIINSKASESAQQ
jgi:hypothetical protein